MCFLQELKGKFLIKGKRLNKLEAIFAQEAATDTDVTEEEESGDEDEDEQKEKARALIRDDDSVSTRLYSPPRRFYLQFCLIFLSPRRRS